MDEDEEQRWAEDEMRDEMRDVDRCYDERLS